VLENTTPSTTKKGELSRANYILPEEVYQEASGRIEALLQDYPVYPELDIALLQDSIQMPAL
jgi:hypothetical protein